MWTSASDLKNTAITSTTFESRRIRMIDLGKMDLNAQEIKTFPMDQQEVIEKISNKTLTATEIALMALSTVNTRRLPMTRR